MIALRVHGWMAAAVLAAAIGPYDIPLEPTTRVSGVNASARLVYATSPFGVAYTVDGHAKFDAVVTAAGLPAPATLGAYTSYVAWAASSDLKEWHRLGVVANGTTTVGSISLDKFLLVITAEASPTSATHGGPVVLRGYSASTFLQTFLTHPLFRGTPP